MKLGMLLLQDKEILKKRSPCSFSLHSADKYGYLGDF